VQLTVTALAYPSTSPAQERFPEQVNAHELPEQTMPAAQAFSPLQLISTLVAPLLTLLWQAFVPLQSTLHALPAQLIAPAHEFDCVHAMSQPAA
jgi:hypothetical protein